MNITKPVACIFPHGAEDFEPSDELLDFLRDNLPQDRQGKYYLRKLGRQNWGQ